MWPVLFFLIIPVVSAGDLERLCVLAAVEGTAKPMLPMTALVDWVLGVDGSAHPLLRRDYNAFNPDEIVRYGADIRAAMQGMIRERGNTLRQRELLRTLASDEALFTAFCETTETELIQKLDAHSVPLIRDNYFWRLFFGVSDRRKAERIFTLHALSWVRIQRIEVTHFIDRHWMETGLPLASLQEYRRL